jgi:enamidase
LPSAGSSARDAFGAITRGDIPGISCVVIDGTVRVARSRNTPLAQRLASIQGVLAGASTH